MFIVKRKSPSGIYREKNGGKTAGLKQDAKAGQSYQYKNGKKKEHYIFH